MITRNLENEGKADIWAQLSAPLPEGVISWRQDGRPQSRDGKHFARFVAYIDAQTVSERLDSVVPGEWDLTLGEPLKELMDESGKVLDTETRCAFKARLQILGTIREDVGHGRDFKQASTDAFKRAAVRFGIGRELYEMEQVWVQVDGDGKYAKALEDPAGVYARKHGNGASRTSQPVTLADNPYRAAADTAQPNDDEAPTEQRAVDEPSCPKCGGRMWDNRLSKRNPKAPDYKCRSRSCDGVCWPAKDGNGPRSATSVKPIDVDDDYDPGRGF